MEVSEITALVTVVQTGSFTKAAQMLGTQKSNVSRTITQLENKLKVRLIERNSRTIAVTQVGHAIYEKCLHLLAILNEAEALAKQEQGKPTGLLRLTCGVEFGMMFVSHWINKYLADNSEVDVEASFTSDLVDLIQEGYDLAIRLGELADSTLIAKRLGELNYGYFASAEYIANHGLPSEPQELSQHNCIIFNAGFKDDWPFLINQQLIKVKVTGRLKIDSLFAGMLAAEAGLGIAKLPLGFVGPNSVLQRVLPHFLSPTVPVYAVYPSSRYLTPRVRAFIDLAAKECERLDFKDGNLLRQPLVN